MHEYEYFDYLAAARRAGISDEDIAALRRRVESEYPSRMLREMHLDMLCKEIGAGRLTVADALKPSTGEMPPPSKLKMGG